MIQPCLLPYSHQTNLITIIILVNISSPCFHDQLRGKYGSYIVHGCMIINACGNSAIVDSKKG